MTGKFMENPAIFFGRKFRHVGPQAFVAEQITDEMIDQCLLLAGVDCDLVTAGSHNVFLLA